MALSFVLDACRSEQNYFPRSGAVAGLMGGVVAYRSLSKHYRKFFNYSSLADVPLTSVNQQRIDRLAFAVTAAGTLVWAYGDILFRKMWA